MKKNGYKILVLSDLKDSTRTTLKSTVSLAKMIGGDIHLFYAKNASDVVKKDNQLSAIRTINQEYTITDKKIAKILKSYTDDYSVNIDYKFTIGNVKNDISAYIEEYKPDIIVLGKRKTKITNLTGNNITDFVLNNYDGLIMIASNKNALEPNSEFAIGLLNNQENSFNIPVAEDLINQTQKSLTSFKIIKNSNELKDMTSSMDKGMVEYIFEYNDNTLDNLSNYLIKNNINLLFIDRKKSNGTGGRNSINSEIKKALNKINISLLLTGKK